MNQGLKPRILIVDDEADFRKIMALTFARNGHEVLTAASGREAFGLLRSSPVDLVISDIRMPNEPASWSNPGQADWSAENGT